MRPYRHGVGVGVHLDVEEIGESGMRIVGTVGQPDVNSHVRIFVGEFGNSALVVENIPLACLEDHVDGVLADDGRKLTGGGADQISHGEVGDPDFSVDRRSDLGVAEIDLGLIEQRLSF